MIIVLGLGNPGKQYEKSRQNVGFSVLDECAKELNLSFRETKKQYAITETSINNNRVSFVKPLTFMNLSGNILPYFSSEKIDKLIVVADNIDLELGKARFRFSGASAGHNGLKSIIAHYGNDFYRLYIGVGRPEGDVINHVLGSVQKEERVILDNVIHNAAISLIKYLNTDDKEAFSRDLSI